MVKYQTTTGFVLGRLDLGEADRIIRLFTLEAGRIDVIARGIRRSKAKLASRTEPLHEIEWRLVHGKQLPVVIGAEVMSTQPTLDLSELQLGFGLLELTEHSFRSDETSTQWYQFLKSGLKQLQPETAALIWLAGLAKSLQQLGLNPDLPIGSRRYVFRIADGQISETGSGLELSPEYLKLWQVARHWPLEKILRIQSANQIATTGNDVLERFWSYHTGRHLHSRQLA